MRKIPPYMAILIIATAILSVYFLLSNNPFPKSELPGLVISDVNLEKVRLVPEGWSEYNNISYHFSLFYPEELIVKERPEKDGASTIVFQNVDKGIGFQIFVLPYREKQISEERFRKDVLSGVRSDIRDVKVDGLDGVTFYSSDFTLGETAEIWFIHEGFLFEVTTIKPLAQWLDDIIKTWLFL
jgi:hypothetical protein